jgi:quinol monooxygenase YgiN
VPAWSHLLLIALLLSSNPEPQGSAAVLSDTRSNAASYFYAVAYVEVTSASAAKAAALLKQYRDASARLDGFVHVEFFEQIGRPGHFASIEVWRDQKTFDQIDASARTQLLSALQGLRVSGYDQRPYKALAVADARPPALARVPRDTVFIVSHVDVTPSPQVPLLLTQLAEASRKEPGNLRFDVVQHSVRANHFTVIEAWRDQKALDAHVAAAHTRQHRDTLQPMTGSPLDERVYRSVD